MRFLLQFLFILLVAWILELFLNWWSIAIAAALGGLLFRSNANFLAGFLAIALLWLFTIWRLETASTSPLSDNVAALFNTDKTILTLITCLLGGLIGGMAALTGGLLLKNHRKRKYY